MDPGRKTSSRKNRASEAFDREQLRLAPLGIIAAAIAAILVRGASLAVLPVLLIIGAVYVFIVYGGARVVRSLWFKGRD
jgi:hypothetical protein